MRSSTVVSVLFAAAALATPLLDRRVLVTKDIVVTVTDYVTAGAVQVQSTSATSTSTAAYHHHHHHQPASSQAQVVAPVPSSSSKPYVAPPATQETTTSTSQPYVAPPATEQTTTSTTQPYVAPPAMEQTTTSTSQPYVAPPATQQTTTSTSPPYVAPPKTTTSPTPSPPTTSTPTQVQSANSNLPTTAVPNLDSASDIYKGLTVQHHNVHRQNHSASDMAWNETLAGYAEQVAKTCIYAHDRTPGGGGYGQNIAAGVEPGRISEVVSNMWYNGEVELFPTPYGNNSPNMTDFHEWGHYSQVVWTDSESVGCYTSTCFPPGVDKQGCKSDGTSYLSGAACGDGINGQAIGVPAYFTVCNYYPAGNYLGDYSKVKQPGSMGTVSISKQGLITGL